MRHKRADYPLRVELLRAALELYVENGFTLTTNQMLADKVGCSTGQITNFFGSKENILCEIVGQVLPFHQGTLSENTAGESAPAVRYCTELALEIAMCEQIETVRDLYINAYTLPKTFALVREYSYRKSVRLFSARLPEWTEQDFFETEALSLGLVYGGLMERCSPRYSIAQKVRRVLDALLKLYEYPEEERREAIDIVLSNDIEQMAIDANARMHEQVEASIRKGKEDDVKNAAKPA